MNLTVSEADFQQAVIDLAILRGWQVSHFRPAQVRDGQWVTPIQGHPGFPDLALARDGVVLLVELKRMGGRVSPMQKTWGLHIGAHYRLWYPNNWAEIQGTLR